MNDMWTGKSLWFYGPPLDVCLANAGIDLLNFQNHEGAGPCDALKKLGNDLGGLYDAADDCQQQSSFARRGDELYVQLRCDKFPNRVRTYEETVIVIVTLFLEMECDTGTGFYTPEQCNEFWNFFNMDAQNEGMDDGFTVAECADMQSHPQ